jgi:hypothetical protein
MTGLLRAFTLALGIVAVPLSASPVTSWLGVVVHLGLSVQCAILSTVAGLGARGGEARAWGLWSVLTTLGLGAALHVASWADGGRAWWGPFVLVLLWGWIPPVVAALAGALGDEAWVVASRLAARRRRASRPGAASVAEQPDLPGRIGA